MMIPITPAVIVAAIAALFLLALAAKPLLRLRLCAICTAVSLTWIALLALRSLGLLQDATLLAILLGQSTVGVFYLASDRAPEPLKVFQLPFLLTLTIAAYGALLIAGGAGPGQLLAPALIVAGLWLIALALYAYRANPSVAGLFRKAVECCKRW